LLDGGVAVCLPDVRGTGETRPGGGRGYNSSATSLSASELLLGQTLLGARLRDVRGVLRYLRGRPDLDARRLALWGDSFAPVNPEGRRLAVPPDASHQPETAEPLGGLLALLAGLFEDDLRAVYIRRGLVGYRSLLDSPFVYVPHDALVPGAIPAGDLCEVAAALAPCPLRLEQLVDGLDRAVSADTLRSTFAPTLAAYRAAAAADHFQLAVEPQELPSARWLLAQLVWK
jgi:hypothetical protein